MNLPKKLTVSTRKPDGSLNFLGNMEWDGDKQFISGRGADGIKALIGDRGRYFSGRIYTLKDRELCVPLMMGYCGLVVNIAEQEKNENDNQD